MRHSEIGAELNQDTLNAEDSAGGVGEGGWYNGLSTNIGSLQWNL